MFTLSLFPQFSIACVPFHLEDFYIPKILKGKTSNRNHHQWKAKALQVKQLSFGMTTPHKFVMNFKKRKEDTFGKIGDKRSSPPSIEGRAQEKQNFFWR